MQRTAILGRGFAVIALLTLGVIAFGPRPATDEEGSDTYVVEPEDWICGLGDPRQLTHPAKVDHEKLLKATPQMQEMRRKRIDPDSARGVILRTEARNEVKRACIVVRLRFEHCSVWRAIRRRDGGPIPDRTKEALSEIERIEAGPTGDLDQVPDATPVAYGTATG